MNATALTIYHSIAERAEAVALVEAGMVLVEKAGQYEGVLTDTDAAVVSELRARLNGHINRLDEERLEMTKAAREAQRELNAEFNEKATPCIAALEKIDAALKAHLKRKADEAEAKRAARAAEEAALRKAEEDRQAAAREAERVAEANRIAAENAARAARGASERAAASGSARAQAAAQKAAREAAEAKAAADRAEAERKATENAAAEQRRADEQRAQELASMPVVLSSSSVRGSYGSSTGRRSNWKYKVENIALVPEAFLVPPDERVQKATLNAMARSQKGAASVPGICFYDDPILQSREGA